jgi:glycine cleavage system H protein
MNEFIYTNIFDTKGIEYIIILSFLSLLVPVWIFISRPVKVKEQIIKAVNVLTAGVLQIPQGLFYSKNHTWTYLEKSGNAKIGIDDFLLHVVGNIKMNLLKTEGDKVEKGDILAEIEQDGKLLKLTSPVSGEIVNINSVVAENSGIVTSDPYGNGWLYSVKPTNWKADITGFFFADEAISWIGNEIQRFKDFLNAELSKNQEAAPILILQEGGELRMYPMEGLDPEIWNEFQANFLNQPD